MLVRGDAGVVDVRILVDFDFGHTGTLDDVLRVAVGGDDHAEGGVGLIPGEFGGFAVENGGDAGTEVGGELREHDFGFRVAEAGVEFDDLRAVGGGDQTGVQDTGEWRTFLGHAFDGGAHDFLDGLVDHGLRNLRHRAVGTHATGVRTLVAIVGALVILGDRHRPEIGAVDKAHQGEFLAVQEVLDNDLGTGGAEAMVDEDVFECALGGVLVHGHGHALACRQTVGLDDNRGTVLVYVVLRHLEIAEGLVLGGRDVVSVHELLGEVLGAFNLGGGLGRAERLDAGGGEIVHDAFDQRDFRAYEHPVITIVLHEFDKCGVIRLAQLRGVDAVLEHARVAGSHGDFVDARCLEQRVGNGVLARAGADNQYFLTHVVPFLRKASYFSTICVPVVSAAIWPST